jgi:hypothetical protein
MHTKSLAMLRMSHVRRELRKAAKGAEGAQSERRQRSSGGAADPVAAGASAVITAMTEKSRAMGSSAADLLQKEADARRAIGARFLPRDSKSRVYAIPQIF